MAAMSAWIIRTGLLVWICTGLGLACSGEPFCEDSRTCGGSSTGGAGNAGEASGGQQSAGQGEGGGLSGSGGAGDGGAGDGGTAPIDALASACTTDDDCDDLDSCTGIEACVGGVCGAGEAVECPVGMECSAEQDDACVFSSAAPWIVYVADDETSGLAEAFAVKSDLLGQMEPVKISAELDAGWEVDGVGPWSPDGSAVVLGVHSQAEQSYRAYAVRFADKLPEPAILLTDGMAASRSQGVSWSPSGQSLLVTRDGGLYAVRFAPAEAVSHARVTPGGFSAVSGVLRDDQQVVWVGQRDATQKWQIARALDQGQGWVQDVLVTEQPLEGARLVPNTNLAFYVTLEGSDRYLYSLETSTAAKPTQLAGPVASVALAGSPDFSYVMVAVSLDGARDTALYAGPVGSAAPLSLLKDHIPLLPNEVISPNGSSFSSDGSIASLFQAGSKAGLRQLVLFDRSSSQPWMALPAPQGLNDGGALWSPDSTLVALSTRTYLDSYHKLAIVSLPDQVVHELATITRDELPWDLARFSGDSQLFFYVYGPPEARRGAYIDLRSGIDAAVVRGDLGAIFQSWSLPAHGTDALFVAGPEAQRDCFYLDLSAEGAAEPVRVNGAGTTYACGFQQLP